jgi:hypothetical protein
MDHLLAQLPHLPLSLPDHPQLVFQPAPFQEDSILVLVATAQLRLPLDGLVDALDPAMLLEVAAFEERMVEDVGFGLRSQFGEVVEVELPQKGRIVLVPEVAREESGAKFQRAVDGKGGGRVRPAN